MFMPFLFGTIGAAVRLDKISPGDIGQGLAIIVIGVTMRWCGVILATLSPKFRCKERMFMGFSWIPKATVQAALGGVVLETALSDNVPQFIGYGNTILTTAVLSVVITAPLGAILTNSLGPIWLE